MPPTNRRLGPIVALDVTVDGESGRVLLKPSAARLSAAGILNDADTAECEGVKPPFREVGGGPRGGRCGGRPFVVCWQGKPPAIRGNVAWVDAMMTPDGVWRVEGYKRSTTQIAWFRLINTERDNVIDDLSIGTVRRLLEEMGYAYADLIEAREPGTDVEHRADETA